MVIAVTGGTGVVGRALLKHLVGEGYAVRALARSGEAREELESLGVNPVPGDLLDAASLGELVDGCTWVFNVAGVNELCVRSPLVMERVNIDGVRNIVRACRQAGVERLVHTSSAVTLGEERGEVGHEGSAHRGWFLSHYERTKYLGERVLFEESAGLDVVAVNPSSVQGPGRATGTGRIILDVVNGRLRFLVDAMVSIVDIDDCARGHVLAARSGEPGERYVLSGSVISVREAVEIAHSALGTSINPHYLPGPVVRALATAAKPISRLLGQDLPFCSEMIRVMTFGHRYDGSRAAEELGIDYRDISETITRTIDWFGREGLLQADR